MAAESESFTAGNGAGSTELRLTSKATKSGGLKGG
jgi:hypothetical protein